MKGQEFCLYITKLDSKFEPTTNFHTKWQQWLGGMLDNFKNR